MPRSVVKLVVAGAEYAGWYSVDMDSDIFTPADGFHVEARVPDDPEFRDVFREGVNADIFVDDDRQMAGVIDDVEYSSAAQRAKVTIAGRDKGAYLIDCEAEHFKAANYTLKSLAETLIKPEWGIRNVIVSNEDNRKLLLGKKDKSTKAGKGTASVFSDRPHYVAKVDPGTRIAAILDERTRQLRVTWWMTAQGDIFIGKPNYDQVAAYDFRCYGPKSPKAKRDTNNCEMRLVYSLGGRYSKITMVGQTSEKDVFDGNDDESKRGKTFRAVVTDPDLEARGIRRETIVTDRDSVQNEDVQNHAEFDMAQRRLNGLRIYVTYPSLRYEENGRLFAVDTLAHVLFEEAGINDTFYVASRRNFVTAKSDRTELMLVQKGVWLA
jgi:prophage tail gpP-like protein